MAVADERDLESYCLDLARRAQAASAELAIASGEQKQRFLRLAARWLRERHPALREANELDLQAAPQFGLTNMPSESWPDFQALSPAFGHFRAPVVSGDEGLVKPDPALFLLAAERAGLKAVLHRYCVMPSRWSPYSSIALPRRNL